MPGGPTISPLEGSSDENWSSVPIGRNSPTLSTPTSSTARAVVARSGTTKAQQTRCLARIRIPGRIRVMSGVAPV